MCDGINVVVLSEDYNFIDMDMSDNSTNVEIYEFCNYKKLDNDKINVLFCSDNNYFVGMFAALQSVIENTNDLNILHFNFIIPLDSVKNFTNMLFRIEELNNIKLDKTIIYIDKNIIDKTIFNSKCYNGGGHLLNIGNISRLLIGEFMSYEKLIYLDSDSILQNDIFERIAYFDLEYDIYSMCADKVDKNHKKEKR